ncbi:MAG TPA: hypothetical protein VGV89_05540 [Thermoplasmata archaeon]|nr:hypothetical protein [Thermoplasmata archaeon]
MSPPWGYGPNPSGVRLPSLARRVTVGLLLLAPLLLFTVGLPAVVLAQLADHGFGSHIGLVQTTVGGAVLSILSSLTYILRPTRVYGPVRGVRAGAAIAYLLFLVPYAVLTLPIGTGRLATIDYAMLLQWLALVPVFSLAGAALITVSDARDVLPRLRMDFPA